MRSPLLLALLAVATAATACAVGSNDLGDSAGDGTGAPSGNAPGDRDAQAAAADDAATTPADGVDAAPASNDASSASDAASSADSSSAADAAPPPPPAQDASAQDSSVSGCAAHGFNGALAAFDLSAQPGSEASVPAGTLANGVASATLTRASAVTATTGSGSINGSNWATGASADATKYYALTITPASGCTLSLASLAIGVRASSTGPTSGDVATSATGFATHGSSFAGTSTGNVAVSASGSGALEVRVYGYGASSSSGTFRIEGTLTVSGAIN